MKHPLISSIYVDHYEGFRLGTAYLLSRGHEKIGICLARKTSVNSMEREKRSPIHFVTKENVAS